MRIRAFLLLLSAFAAAAPASAQSLVDRLLAQDPAVQTAAQKEAQSLSEAAQRELARSLAIKMRDPLQATRYAASRAMGSLGAVAVPVLLPLLHSANTDWRYRASESLGIIAAPAIPALTAVLREPNNAVRCDAVRAFGRMGAAAQPAVPELVALVTVQLKPDTTYAPDTYDADTKLRSCVVETLGRIGGAAALKAVESALGDPEKEVTWAALNALTAFGDSARGAVPAVLALSKEDGALAQDIAYRTLGAIGKGDPQVVAVLADAARDKGSYFAIAALEELGAGAAAAVPDLILAFRKADDPSTTRSAVVRALKAIGTPEALAAVLPSPAERAGGPAPDGARLFTRLEIDAPIAPPDNDHKALKLRATIDLPGPGGRALLATIHSAEGLPEYVSVWRPEAGGYRRTPLEEWESVLEPVEETWAELSGFRYGQEHFVHLMVGISGTGSMHTDTFYWIAPDLSLRKIVFQSGPNGYKGPLQKGQGIWKGETNMFADDKMEFEFSVWNADDANCCPTGGRLKGTYKLEGRAPNFRIAPAGYTRLPVEP